MSPIPAARFTDPIEHTNAMAGFIMGAVAGAALALTAVAVIGTGGAALGVVAAVGGVIATTGGAAMIGAAIGQMFTSVTGAISATCSTNVFINDLGAARGELDRADCDYHPGHPGKQIATGAATVLINDYPAARKDEALVCGAWISDGSENVLIGGPSVQLLEISPEIPDWLWSTAEWMVKIGGVMALGAGLVMAAAAGTCGMIMLGMGVGGALLGEHFGGELGGIIGYAIDGERGQAIGEMAGSFLGGFAGGFLGLRTGRGHPVDVATGEVFTSNTDFQLPGPLPLEMTRYWMSSSHESGATGTLGRKWSHNLDLRLHRWPEMQSMVLRQADGHLVFFPYPAPGQPTINVVDRAMLHVTQTKHGPGYTVSGYDGHSHVFVPDPADPDGFLLWRMADANKNDITLSRDAYGHLTGIRDSAGRDLTVTTNDHGWIKAIDGPAPTGSGRIRLVSYEYSRDGDMIAATDARGNAWRYEYINHLLVRETSRGGLVYQFRWDDPRAETRARCLLTWGESSEAGIGNLHYAAFEYDAEMPITRVTDAAGAVVLYEHDLQGRVLRQVDPAGVETRFAYDISGNETSMRDDIGRGQATEYDQYGRALIIRQRNGLNLHLSYGSDDPLSPLFGTVTEEVEGEGPESVTEKIDCDPNGNVVSRTDGMGHVVRILRDARGLPVAEIDELGTRWRWQWNPQGLISAEGPDRLTRFYSYDALGRMVSERDGAQTATQFDHDPNGNVIRLTMGDGRRANMEYDADDNLILHRDPLGNITREEFAGLPRPIMRINADGSRVQCRYDYEVRPLELSNGNGEIALSQYNQLGQLSHERGFDGVERHYRYDRTGYPSEVMCAGRVTKPQFDRVGNLVSLTSDDGYACRFEWTAQGQISATTANDVTSRFTYDPLGRPVSEETDGQITGWEYDCRSNVIATILPGGEVIRRSYDPAGEISRMELAGEQIAHWRYAHSGELLERMQVGSLRSYSWDTQGRLATDQLTASHLPGSGPQASVLVARQYGWNENNNLSSVGDSLRGTRQFSYDHLNRLVDVQGAMPERMAYDKADNLTAISRLLPGQSGPDGEIAQPEIDGFRASASGDRLHPGYDSRLEYDDRGNITEIATTDSRLSLRYGANDMLVETCRETADKRIHARYRYDAFVRRISKEIVEERLDEYGTVVSRTETGTAYLWDGDCLLAEGPIGGDPLARIYLYEADGLTPLGFSDRQEDGSRALFYCNTDLVGMPQEVVDTQGRIVWAAQYTAYGVALADLGSGFHQPLRFPGQYHDPETGLHYNRNRYYMPQFGRYTQPDPIGLLGGLNAYFYPTNPFQGCDPLGLDEVERRLGVIHVKPRHAGPFEQGGRRTGVNRAWAQEAELVRSYDEARRARGETVPKWGHGTRRWTPAQKAQLLSTGKVAGFDGHHINTVQDNPHMKGDPRNIRFLPNSKHPSLGNQHAQAPKGHRGNTRNTTRGRLIDRRAMINRNNTLARSC